MIVRKMLLCVALATMFTGAVGSTANANAETGDVSSTVVATSLAELEEVLAEAEAEVVAKQEIVDEKAELLAQAEADLLAASELEAAAQAAVDDATDALAAANAELTSAIAERDAAQLAYDGIVCTGLTGQTRATCNHDKEAALSSLDAATDAIEPAAAEVTAAEESLVAAQAELDAATEAVTAATAAVDEATAALAAAEADLAVAEAERDAAKLAVETYVAPLEDKHPGCNGVQNAQVQVATSGNSKGKAAETLASVASKFGC